MSSRQNSRSIMLLLTTVPDEQSARKIVDTLLQKNLSACCLTLPRIHSTFIWNAQKTDTLESLLLCKVPTRLAQRAKQCIEALHPYETPAILTIAAHANLSYATWMNAVCEQSRKKTRTKKQKM